MSSSSISFPKLAFSKHQNALIASQRYPLFSISSLPLFEPLSQPPAEDLLFGRSYSKPLQPLAVTPSFVRSLSPGLEQMGNLICSKSTN